MTTAVVRLHNQTGQDLVLVGTPDLDGDWRGSPPPAVLHAGEVVITGSEASIDIPLGPDVDGTEVSLTYQGANDPNTTFYVHWDVPAIGRNSFHTNADPGHYSFWRAQGDDEVDAYFAFRDAGKVLTDFTPGNDGFRFKNKWDDAPYSLPPLRDTPLDAKYGNASNGLCGGMVFAALDYFLAEQRIPTTEAAPAGEQDPLFLYLVDRLIDSFDVRSITLLLALMNPIAPDGDEELIDHADLSFAPCRARVMAHVEWPLIRADIDAGQPSPIVLQTVKSLLPTDMGKCHQVLVTGYEARGHDITLFIYDPNNPKMSDRFMRFQDGDISHRIVVDHNLGVYEDDDVTLRPIYAFARMNYERRAPRVPTEPRLRTVDIANRGVSVVIGAPELQQPTSVESSGRRSYDIWPDCGTAEMDYTVVRQKWSYPVSITVHGFYDPVVTLDLGGTEITLDGGTTYTLPSVATFQPGPPRPGQLGIGVEEAANPSVFVRGAWTDADHAGLDIFTEPADGNYTLDLGTRCREADEPANSPKRFSYPLEVPGWIEDTPGLQEARAQCFRKYLNSHRAGLPDVAHGALDILVTLPGGPADPLGDPDPVFAGALDKIRASDPRFTEIAADRDVLQSIQHETRIQLKDLLVQKPVVDVKPGGFDINVIQHGLDVDIPQ